MQKTVVAAAAIAAASFVFAGAAVAGGFQFRTTLTGAQEVPVKTTSAEAKLNVKLGDGSATYNLRITSPIQNITQAHIHKGDPGVNGPIAVWLFPAAPPATLVPGTTEGRLAKGSFDADDLCYSATAPYCVNGHGNWDGFVADLKTGKLYANVHTQANPGGEVRGQVHANHG